MIKVGDKVRILENAVVGSDNIIVTKLHNHFHNVFQWHKGRNSTYYFTPTVLFT